MKSPKESDAVTAARELYHRLDHVLVNMSPIHELASVLNLDVLQWIARAEAIVKA
jgi:hypothetical protein